MPWGECDSRCLFVDFFHEGQASLLAYFVEGEGVVAVDEVGEESGVAEGKEGGLERVACRKFSLLAFYDAEGVVAEIFYQAVAAGVPPQVYFLSWL